MADQSPKKKRGKSKLTPLAVVLWTAAALGFCFVTSYVYDRGQSAFGGLHVRLPAVMEGAMYVGALLHTPAGILIACSAYALSVAPFALGARGSLLTGCYFALASMFAAAIGLVWLGNSDVLQELSIQLRPTPGR
jgi:hypothetical protein